jgi:hypothetical protein
MPEWSPQLRAVSKSLNPMRAARRAAIVALRKAGTPPTPAQLEWLRELRRCAKGAVRP